MHAIVTEKQRELAELCRRHGVLRLALFGSVANDDFDPGRSDLDFLVEFAPAPRNRSLDSYFALLWDLERLFGRKVDLVEWDAVRNPYIRANIEATRELLYAA